MTARQLFEWMAFYRVDPFGDQRGDLQASIVASTIANTFRGKNQNPIEPMKFMPFADVQEQTPEEIQRTLRTILGQVITDG